MSERLDRKPLKPVTDLDRYKSSLKDKEQRKQFGADPDKDERLKRRGKRCPYKNEKWVCELSHEIPRADGELHPFHCTALDWYGSCGIYLQNREAA